MRRHDAVGTARATRPRRSTSWRSYVCGRHALVRRLVRAVREDDQRRRAMLQLFGPVLLVPLEAGRHAGAVDAERVEHDAGLRAIERDAEHADVTVAGGADLELVRGGLAHVERAERAGRAFAARRDADDADAVDEDVERAAVRLLEVRDLGARGARGDVRPRARAVLARLDADAREAVEAVAGELPLRQLAALRRPLVRHPATDSLLEVALPRFADRDEAATAVAESSLERAPDHGGLDVRGGVRVAELDDAHVLLRLTGLEPARRTRRSAAAMRVARGRRRRWRASPRRWPPGSRRGGPRGPRGRLPWPHLPRARTWPSRRHRRTPPWRRRTLRSPRRMRKKTAMSRGEIGARPSNPGTACLSAEVCLAWHRAGRRQGPGSPAIFAASARVVAAASVARLVAAPLRLRVGERAGRPRHHRGSPSGRRVRLPHVLGVEHDQDCPLSRGRRRRRPAQTRPRRGRRVERSRRRRAQAPLRLDRSRAASRARALRHGDEHEATARTRSSRASRRRSTTSRRTRRTTPRRAASSSTSPCARTGASRTSSTSRAPSARAEVRDVLHAAPAVQGRDRGRIRPRSRARRARSAARLAGPLGGGGARAARILRRHVPREHAARGARALAQPVRRAPGAPRGPCRHGDVRRVGTARARRERAARVLAPPLRSPTVPSQPLFPLLLRAAPFADAMRPIVAGDFESGARAAHRAVLGSAARAAADLDRLSRVGRLEAARPGLA